MPSYPCLVCGRVFSRRGSLRNHSKTHNTVVDRVLQEISEVVEREQLEEEINVETSDNELVGMEVSDDEQEEIIDNDEQLEMSNDEQEEEVIDDEHLESMGDDEQVENDEEEIDDEEEEEEEKEEEEEDKEVKDQR
jgi:hypothetical protein